MVQRELPIVATPLKFSIESVVAQIEAYREEVRKNNKLCAEHNEFLVHLLQTLDSLRDTLVYIYEAIPQNVESVSTEDAENVAGFMERFKNENAIQVEKYLSPEALNRAMFPFGDCIRLCSCGFVLRTPGTVAGDLLETL